MKFYQHLKEIREDNEKTQREIAELLQITQQEYDLYETGKRKIAMHQLIIIAKYYNVSLDYLAGIIDTPRKLK